jgi:Flp pilus assembly protein TadG
MMRAFRLALRNRDGAAAVEMALVAPLLLIIMCGSVELGNYFMNEHSLVKAIRDGARFAARQSFTNYPDCSTVSTAAQDATKNVVMYGYLSGSTVLTPNIAASDITVSTSCATSAGGQTMQGIYRGRTTGAQTVTVTATVNYRPILSSFGFTGIGLTIYAASQAAVQGI